jgi:hypothetical protein
MDSMTTSHSARALRRSRSALTPFPVPVVHGTGRTLPARVFAWSGSVPRMPAVQKERQPTNDRLIRQSAGSAALTIHSQPGTGHTGDRRRSHKIYAALLNVVARPALESGLARDKRNFFEFRILPGRCESSRTPAFAAFTLRETMDTVPSRMIPVTP